MFASNHIVENPQAYCEALNGHRIPTGKDIPGADGFRKISMAKNSFQ
jgi:hypothetical protein